MEDTDTSGGGDDVFLKSSSHQGCRCLLGQQKGISLEAKLVTIMFPSFDYSKKSTVVRMTCLSTVGYTLYHLW